MKFHKASIVLIVIVIVSQRFSAGLNPTSANSPSHRDWTFPKFVVLLFSRV